MSWNDSFTEEGARRDGLEVNQNGREEEALDGTLDAGPGFGEPSPSTGPDIHVEEWIGEIVEMVCTDLDDVHLERLDERHLFGETASGTPLNIEFQRVDFSSTPGVQLEMLIEIGEPVELTERVEFDSDEPMDQIEQRAEEELEDAIAYAEEE